MHFKALFICLFAISALVFETSAFAVVLSAQGDAGHPSNPQPSGPYGVALGVDPSTPRTGSAVDPHKRDTTIFKQRTFSTWKGCGQTIQSGVLQADILTPKLVQQGQIAKVSAGGYLFMILHQISGSGNGPYTCGIDQTGAGTSFPKKLEVDRQVPGQSPMMNTVVTTQFPFQVAMPTDLKCSGSYGGVKGICMIRCQNAATSGPYGACIPVRQV